MKKFFLIIMIALFSLNVSGCEDLDNFSLMPEEENSVEEAEEKNTSESESENKSKNESENIVSNAENERNNSQNKNSASIDNTKNEIPFVSLNKNLPVRKDEMDKLVRIARNCKWNENDVKKAVIILKNCGIDVANIDQIETFNEGTSSGYIISVKPHDDELIRENFYLQMSLATREIEKVFVKLNSIYDLYVREDNTEKIVGNCDNLFLKMNVYEKIEKNVVNFINSKGGRYNFKYSYQFSRLGNKRGCIYIERNYDSAKRTIIYEVDTSRWFSAEIPSEVYGVEFEKANFHGIFDSNGNTISMNFEKKQ